MKKSVFRYNTKTLAYEEVKPSTGKRVLRWSALITSSLIFGFVIFLVADQVIDSPEKKRMRRMLEQQTQQLQQFNQRMEHATKVLDDLQQRDDNIYRVIFEADPIPEDVRKAGFGGINRYRELQSMENGQMLAETSQKLDILTKQIYVQSKSFDEVIELAHRKEEMLASIPAIQPVSNKDLKRLASGYGYRIHPIFKTKRMHFGMDFTAPSGTEIYATGNGVVVERVKSKKGYGNHVVVDHGFGYKTLYAHMSEFNVRKGQKIKRGDVLGYVGNTGTSTAPHLHYEVIKNGRKINPVNFYFNDLTPEEFDRIIQLSSTANQSFD